MDLALAASGSGYGHTECPQGIPIEFALLSILAAFGAAFGILYVALTQQTMGRRRRRRNAGFEQVEDEHVHDDGGQLLSHQYGEEGEQDVAMSVKLADIFMLGELLGPWGASKESVSEIQWEMKTYMSIHHEEFSFSPLMQLMIQVSL